MNPAPAKPHRAPPVRAADRAEESRAPVVILGFRPQDRFGELVGGTPEMHAAFERLRRAAAHELTVLLCGESGTGKELAARGIHAASSRATRPFVVFDCAAVSPQLVESELFGVVKGAYTGAEVARDGVASAADGGTLLLDEVGELPLDLQPKLLRLLDRRELRRVGEAASHHVDLRIIAATNRDLRADVAAGRFRADLYHRLAVAEVYLPPLRQRRGDLHLLVRHLLAQERSWRGELLPGSMIRMLEQHVWPGNVRELRNVVQRWLHLAGSGVDFETLATTRVATPRTDSHAGSASERAVLTGRPADLGDTFPASEIDPALSLGEMREKVLAWLEPRYLTALLRASGGNVSEASRRANIARKTFYELLHRHGMAPNTPGRRHPR